MIKKQMLAHTSEEVTMPHFTRIARDHGRVWPRLSFFCFLSLFLLFLNTPVIGGTIELPQTGQTTCYDDAGNPIACANTGQDGDFVAGLAWPAERFSLYNNCIIDSLTGLMWYRYAYTTNGVADWEFAVSSGNPYITLCGSGGWRLPNINELQSLVNAEKNYSNLWLADEGFYFPQSVNLTYWSSTSWAPDTSNAWTVNMVDGSVLPQEKLGNPHYVWLVRSHQTPTAALWKTGQVIGWTTSPYDDGSLRIGTTWPDPRFTLTYCDGTGTCADQDEDCDADESNNIVKDNLTGLVWSVNANAEGLKTWDNALALANDLTKCGYGDWRLPNSKELFSLVDRSQSDPALPSEHPFTNIQPEDGDLYWSSSSYASDPSMAWTMDMFDGALEPWLKTDTAFVWPVRGGKTRPYVLTVKKEGTGKGKITATDLSCVGATCTGHYNSYEEVIVTAKPAGGSVFAGWTDCPSPSGDTCAITMTDDIIIKATFLPEYKISISPRSLNFKNLKQNIESGPLSVTVKNAGMSDLQISSVAITEDPTSVFAIFSNDCPATLASIDPPCLINITATAPDYDLKTAELQISSNDPKKPLTIVRLKAKAKPPKIARKPSGLSFGKVAVGVPAEKVLTLTNKGITDLVIGAITIVGDHPGDFSPLAADDCSGATLVTDGTCTVTVTFTPSIEGKRIATLQIPSNDPNPKRSSLIVNLKGTGK